MEADIRFEFLRQKTVHDGSKIGLTGAVTECGGEIVLVRKAAIGYL